MSVTFAPDVRFEPTRRCHSARGASDFRTTTNNDLMLLGGQPVFQPQQQQRSRSFRQLPRSTTTSSSASDLDELQKLNRRLSLAELEKLVCRTIPNATGNNSGVHPFQGLAIRCSSSNKKKNDPELLAVADWLLDFLSDGSSQKLPASTLSDIHSYIGLIRQWNGEYESSHRAFLSAAFVAKNITAGKEDHRTLIAASLYRLATSYGHYGHQKLMYTTIEKAIAQLYGNNNGTTSSSSGAEMA